MGRESDAWLTYGGASGAGKLLLESTEIILRGAVRARIPRSAIAGFAQDGDDLVIQTPQGALRAGLAPKDAARWVAALAKPIPTLATKLGVSRETPIRVLGDVTDTELQSALSGSVSPAATMLLAELNDVAQLDAALRALADPSLTTFWGVTVKGKATPLPEATLRSRLRDAGFIDTKSCAVSQTRSATRFQRR